MTNLRPSAMHATLADPSALSTLAETAGESTHWLTRWRWTEVRAIQMTLV